MHTHILIPTDGSDLSAEAIQYGTALAKAVNARVTGVTVSTPFHIFAVEQDTIQDTLESYRQRMTTVAAQRLDKVKEAAEAAGVDCELVHVEHAHPYNAIIDIAKAKGCDLIVMASHGRSMDFSHSPDGREADARLRISWPKSAPVVLG